MTDHINIVVQKTDKKLAPVWHTSLRSGMISHALTDILGGLPIKFL